MSIKAYLKQFSSNPKTRDKAVWKQLHSKAQRHGFEMYKSNVVWREDAEFQAARREWGAIPGNSSDRVFFFIFHSAGTKQRCGGYGGYRCALWFQQLLHVERFEG